MVFFGIRIHQKRQHGAINSGRRFNHVRIKPLLGLLVEIRKILGRIRILRGFPSLSSGFFDCVLEIEISSIRHPH
jgi:hypothetical protein